LSNVGREMGLAWLCPSFLFDVLEAVGFLLPAFPPTLPARLLILAGYATAHLAGLQYRYAAFKRRCLAETNHSHLP
jgi:predicted metal-binding membrane protein